MVASPATLRLSDVIADVKRAFGDESGVQIKDSDIIRWTNQAQREIVSKNPINKAIATSSSVVDQQIYPMPVDAYQIESVQFDRTWLKASGFEEAQIRYGTDPAMSGDPDSWYMWGNNIYIHPAPNIVKTISVYYTQAPISVNSPGDLLGLPDRYFNAISSFCLAKCYELDEDFAAQQVKHGEFNESMRDLSNAENNQQGAFLVLSDRNDEVYW